MRPRSWQSASNIVKSLSLPRNLEDSSKSFTLSRTRAPRTKSLERIATVIKYGLCLMPDLATHSPFLLGRGQTQWNFQPKSMYRSSPTMWKIRPETILFSESPSWKRRMSIETLLTFLPPPSSTHVYELGILEQSGERLRRCSLLLKGLRESTHSVRAGSDFREGFAQLQGQTQAHWPVDIPGDENSKHFYFILLTTRTLSHS